MLVLMLFLATTELGTDSWVKDLLGPAIGSTLGIDAGWVLVYTALIMMVLRFRCGPLVQRLQPLGVLAISAALVAAGIFWLSVLGGDPDTTALVVIIAANRLRGRTDFLLADHPGLRLGTVSPRRRYDPQRYRRRRHARRGCSR